MKILILDDEVDYVDQFQELCEEAGLDPPLTAGCVADALEVARSQRAKAEFLLAFVDIGLAGESGLSFVDTLNEAGTRLPVCILSDTQDKDIVFKAARKDIAAFIEKDRLRTGADLLVVISDTVKAYSDAIEDQLSLRTHATAALADFYGEFVHDVREVFAPIRSGAEEILDIVEGPAEEVSLVQLRNEAKWIVDKAEIGRKYVEALKEFRDSGQLLCRRERVDVRKLISRLWEAHRRPKDTLVLDHLPDEVTFSLDRRGIDRIFNALFENVRAHVPEPAEVRVILRQQQLQEAEYLHIGFGDDGPGIPKTEWEQVFLPGRRLGDGGMGLGLSVLSRSVLLHQLPHAIATARCAESPIGQGAWFEIALPLETTQ